jgi:hypothetical protein
MSGFIGRTWWGWGFCRCSLMPGQNAESLHLTGEEVFAIGDTPGELKAMLEGSSPMARLVTVFAERPDLGKTTEFRRRCGSIRRRRFSTTSTAGSCSTSCVNLQARRSSGSLWEPLLQGQPIMHGEPAGQNDESAGELSRYGDRKAWTFCSCSSMRDRSGRGRAVHHSSAGGLAGAGGLKMDSTAIAAGCCTMRSKTRMLLPEIAKQFGEQVAHIVEGVTKLDKIKFANREDHQAENIRKMLLAMVTDVRVVIIKLADRLHNMRTLEHLNPEKQQKIARETLDIYAPLAHRLGMGKLRGELEDLAFQYTDPFAYEQVSAEVDALRGAGEEFLQKIVTQLEKKLKEQDSGAGGVADQAAVFDSAEADGSEDSRGSGVRSAGDSRDLQDGAGLLCAAWACCTASGGRCRGGSRTLSRCRGRILYQSLHTTLIAPRAGISSRCRFARRRCIASRKKGLRRTGSTRPATTFRAKDEQRLAWVRQLMEWQREMTDPNEFMSTLKIDLYPEEVYTFHAEGQGGGAAEGREPDRFCVYDSYRGRQYDHRREGEWADRSAADQAAERRHRRDFDAGGTCSQPRLA